MEKDAVQTDPQQPTEESVLSLRQQIEELQKKCDEYLAGWQRAKADYSNREKDIAREKAEFVKFAHEAFLRELIPIVDNFNEAMTHIPNEHKTDQWVTGIELVKKQVFDFLKNLDVESYGTEGDVFDPHRFEALDEVEGGDEKKGKIAKIVRKGYTLYGRVLRPGQVIVGK